MNSVHNGITQSKFILCRVYHSLAHQKTLFYMDVKLDASFESRILSFVSAEKKFRP